MSHGSKTTVAAADSPPNSDGLSSTTTRALSYESKEETKTHTTTATANAANNSNNKSKSGTNSTSPKSTTQFPSHSLVPYFPSALHWLLTESSSQTASPEYAAARSVLQWVPHGQALRVVRWDALRSQVLPQFFPQLVASVDAFLWHLAAWGFEEIPDGPDVGAFGHTVRCVGLCGWGRIFQKEEPKLLSLVFFSHCIHLIFSLIQLFRRGHPQLCQEMKFAPENVEGLIKVDDSRSILRVPSLATAGSNDAPSSSSEHQDKDPARNSSNSSAAGGSSYTGTPPHHHAANNTRHRSPFAHRGAAASWGTSPSSVRSAVGPPIYVNYRPEEMNMAANTEVWQYYPGKAAPPPPGSWMHGHAAAQHPGAQQGGNVRAQGMPPYSPIRIRSTRGAPRRLSLSSNAAASIRHTPSGDSSSTVPSASTRSFPVSNRGKGRRHVAASLSSKSVASDVGSSETLTMLQNKKPDTTTTEAGGGSAEGDRSRSPLKRKLPLASSTSVGGGATGAGD